MMFDGQEIGLKDANGVEIKIGDYLIVDTWRDPVEDITYENVLTKVIWNEFAVKLVNLRDRNEKFFSFYSRKPNTIRVTEARV